MQDLIARLEAATEGSRELDVLVAIASDATMKWYPAPGKPGCVLSHRRDLTGAVPCERYTTSLDIALTLIKEGWHVSHSYWSDSGATFNLTFKVGVYSGGTSATPALALCIAALKARKEI